VIIVRAWFSYPMHIDTLPARHQKEPSASRGEDHHWPRVLGKVTLTGPGVPER